MTYEKSCGGVVYRKFHGNIEILLIRHTKYGKWTLPKGHMENGETEEETALREIKEETNADVFIDTGFRETVSYHPRKNTLKEVVYFIARVRNRDLVPQKGEVAELKWAEISQVHNILAYSSDKMLINHAKSFLAHTSS